MGLEQRTPPAPLAGLIEKIWDWDMPLPSHRLERVLPLPGAALIINLVEDETRVYTDADQRQCIRSAGAVLGGPRLSSQIIDTAEQVRVMGVVFRPGGAHAFTAEDLSNTVDRDIDLHDVFGPGAARLRARLLETAQPQHRLQLLHDWLLRRLRPDVMNAAISQAAMWLEAVPQVARIPAIARAVGLSERRFTDSFRRQIGMTPKHYARLARFRGVINLAHAQPALNWSDVALDCGYCDQAHLSHEFRRFAGITPAAFMAARGPYRNHLPLD